MEQRLNGKCSHGVYWPEGHPKAYHCQHCNPAGTQSNDVFVLPQSSGDPLNVTRSGELETCEQCGNLRTYSSTSCRVCGKAFPLDDVTNRHQHGANLHQSGSCPKCGSTVHIETEKKSLWECADCSEQYPAPKGRRA